MRKKILFLFLLIVFSLTVVSASQVRSDNYETDIFLSGGGTNISSSNYKLEVIVGTIAGNSSSVSYLNYIGYFVGGRTGAVCRNGFVQEGEECDDGNVDNTDFCTSECKLNICGDGFVYSGYEECDDKDLSNNNACKNDCTLNTCGDGYSYTGVEECDDGDNDNNDGCKNDCTLNTCGDGYRSVLFEGCDDGNTVSGDGCSSSCTVEEDEEDTGTTSSSSGGGGGGAIPEKGLLISESKIEVNLLVSTQKEVFVKITNGGSSERTVTVSESGLEAVLIIRETSFQLGPGESKNLGFVFLAPTEAETYAGKIFISGNTIFVSVNVATSLAMFDSKITVLNSGYKVEKGDKLRTKVDLIPMGEKERLDVLLSYVIKDYNGRIYFSHNETVLVERQQIEFKNDFDTFSLPVKEYVIILKVYYSNGVAPSSAHFEVVKKGTFFKGRLTLYLISLILLVAIIIIVIFIVRIVKKKQSS